MAALGHAIEVVRPRQNSDAASARTDAVDHLLLIGCVLGGASPWLGAAGLAM